MEFHPLADLFPMMSPEEFAGHVESIRANGLIDPIVRYEGKILDGRNRYRGCREAGVEPAYMDFIGADPLAFVIARNLDRRNLDKSQRAMVAARMANMKKHDNQNTKAVPSIEGTEKPLVSQEDAAKRCDVSVASVERAARVITNAVPEIIAMVDAGELKVHAAREISMLRPEKQKEHAAKGADAVKRVASNLDLERPCRKRTQEKQAEAEADTPVKKIRKEAKAIWKRLKPHVRALQGLMKCDRSTFAPTILAGHANVLDRELSSLFKLLGDLDVADDSD